MTGQLVFSTFFLYSGNLTICSPTALVPPLVWLIANYYFNLDIFSIPIRTGNLHYYVISYFICQFNGTESKPKSMRTELEIIQNHASAQLVGTHIRSKNWNMNAVYKNYCIDHESFP
jgi:hypothetical protein